MRRRAMKTSIFILSKAHLSHTGADLSDNIVVAFDEI